METFVMRYIVPFSYKKKKGSAYDYLNDCLSKSPEWKNVRWEQGEQDCYEYLKELYPLYEEDYGTQSGVGTIWEYHDNGNRSLLPSIVYQNEKVSPAVLHAKVSKAGLFVLKNGVGLFWYETNFYEPTGNKKDKPKIDLEHLTYYQNEIKELAQADKHYHLLFQREARFSEKAVKPGKNQTEEDFLKVEILKQEKESLGKIEELTLLKNKHIINQKAAEEQVAVTYQLKSDMLMGSWVHKILGACDSGKDMDISYYPGRKRRNAEAPGEYYMIPDKAILFQYVVADVDDARLEELAYRLTNGYKKSYVMPSNIRERMYEPFGNIIWYAEKEGCGTYANYNEDNEAFLFGTKKTRVCNDYFFMYMNLLQQSYVALNLAEEIATTFSMSGNDYQSGNLKTGRKLEDIQMRINVFLLKSTHASVSHIGHHNAFYKYVEKNLLIKEDIESLHEGLDSLQEIQKRHEDDKVTIGLGVLSVFAILAAFGDADSLIDIFVTNTQVAASLKTVAYAIIGIIFLLVIIALKDTHKKFFRIAGDEVKEIFNKPRRRKKKEK